MNYDEAVGRLTALGDAPDPDLLDRTVEPLEQAMRTDDPQGYAWFVIAVCDELNSRDLGDWRRQDELVGKYARLGLRHATVLSPAAELRLLEHEVRDEWWNVNEVEGSVADDLIGDVRRPRGRTHLHAARRHRVSAAGQHRAVGTR